MGNLTEVIGTMEQAPNAEVPQVTEQPSERRRRLRTKLSAPVRVRLNSGALQKAEVCTTVDASRDGLLFTSKLAEYRRGMDVVITFPYSGAAGGVQHERTAVVARVFEMPEGRFGIGVRFYEGKRPDLSTKAPTAGDVARDLEKPMPLVLVVEADARARDAIRTVLVSEGYVAEAVETGAEAVEFLRQRTP
ncbi:MAG: PilZ domain-containing protein, partial [Candidatus Acidiferrales bacterium]